MTTTAESVPSIASNEDVPPNGNVPSFDADRRWRLHERVALRPEPFGALAYHYGNRRLTFLRSPDLVALVERLADEPSARAAFDAAGIDAKRWPSFEKALTSLAAGEFLVSDLTEDPT
jgi:putative mycofactocin binding protein MftB